MNNPGKNQMSKKLSPGSIYEQFSDLFTGYRKWFWVTTVVVLMLDQATKMVYASTGSGGSWRVEIIPGFLEFIHRMPNQHGVFGLGPGTPIFYMVATLGGLGLIAYFLINMRPGHLSPHLGLGLLCGGALGNLIDRMVFSAVRDFIKMAFWPFVYNVADAAICAGVVFLLFEAFTAEELDKERVEAP